MWIEWRLRLRLRLTCRWSKKWRTALPDVSNPVPKTKEDNTELIIDNDVASAHP